MGPEHSPSNTPKLMLAPKNGVLGLRIESTRERKGFRSTIGLVTGIDVATDPVPVAIGVLVGKVKMEPRSTSGPVGKTSNSEPWERPPVGVARDGAIFPISPGGTDKPPPKSDDRKFVSRIRRPCKLDVAIKDAFVEPSELMVGDTAEFSSGSGASNKD